VKLLGAESQGSGAVNEDGFGYVESDGDVSAAWIFDGVTGINPRNHLDAGTDAEWLVARAQSHIMELAPRDMALDALLRDLVSRLISDWTAASAGLDLPRGYDPPATCLVLVKRYADGWQCLRLGDSCLLAREAGGSHRILAASPNNSFDHWLAREAQRRRQQGVFDVKLLLAEFAPQLKEARARRNRPDGYSVLECSRDSLAMPEILRLGWPAQMLLCTDGYYRAVDTYGLMGDAQLMDASALSVSNVLKLIRSTEAADPDASRYPRFKPADDATALMLALNEDI
jgi:hypothetical protein